MGNEIIAKKIGCNTFHFVNVNGKRVVLPPIPVSKEIQNCAFDLMGKATCCSLGFGELPPYADEIANKKLLKK